MSSLGTHLRQLRDARGVPLEEIARSSRVAVRYLEALEADDFSAMPAPVFVRGFIRAYCQALHEPPEAALALYRGGGARAPAGPPGPPRRPAQRVEAERQARSIVLVSFVLLVILGVGLFAMTLVLDFERPAAKSRPAAADRVAVALAPVPEPSAPEPVPRTAPEDVAAAEAPGPEVSPGPPPSPPAVAVETPRPVDGPPAGAAPGEVGGAVTAPYRLVARAVEPTWVRVSTETGRLSEETIPAGEVREWVSHLPFILTVGNAGGITLELNGHSLPPLGASGVVVSRLVLPPPQP
jgi:cytoskeleton protein RodZ